MDGTSTANNHDSTDLQERKSPTKTPTMTADTHARSVKSPTLAWPEEKLIDERTIANIRYIAIMGIMFSFLIPIIIVGILTLIFSLQQELSTGTILLYSGNALVFQQRNNHWLFCDGSAVSRTTYANLFAVLGVTYGAGNGIDTFNLPDFRTRFPLGSTASSDTSLIAGGYSSHTITVPELPAHRHNAGSLGTATSGTHSHAYTDPGHNHGGTTGNGPFGSSASAMIGSGSSGNGAGTHSHSIPSGMIGITIQPNGAHTHTISGSTGSTGGGQPFDIMPPYQTVHYIIRT